MTRPTIARMTDPCRAKPRFWFSRLIIALEVLVLIAGVSWFEPASLTSKAIEQSGHFGWVLILGLFVMCGMAIVDVIVNDLMPARFVWACGLGWRHLSFMGIALILAFLGMLVAFTLGYTPLLLAYWLNAVLAALVTILDVFARFRSQAL